MADYPAHLSGQSVLAEPDLGASAAKYILACFCSVSSPGL